MDDGGGPNWKKNVVDAPIIVDTKTPGQWFVQPMFYYLAHFSLFVPPGSVRVGIVSASSSVTTAAMEAVAFLTPDSTAVVVVVLNRAWLGQSRTYSISVDGRAAMVFKVDIPADAVQSITLSLAGDEGQVSGAR